MNRDFICWFTGFFDADGCFHLSARRRNGRTVHYRYGISILQRQDRRGALEYIHDTLGVGHITDAIPTWTGHNSKPISTFRIYAIADLANVILPVFDQCPFRTKKSREYVVWRQAIQYANKRSNGGTTKKRLTEDDHQFFQECIAKLKEIRKYKPQGGNNGNS